MNREEIGKNQEGIYSGEMVVTLLNLVGVRESVVTLVQRGSPYSPCSQLKAYSGAQKYCMYLNRHVTWHPLVHFLKFKNWQIA